MALAEVSDLISVQPSSSPDALSFEHIEVLIPTHTHSTKAVLYQEWIAYLESISAEATGQPIDLIEYWNTNRSVFPHLSKLARSFIWLRPSAVDVERPFSFYRKILTPQRHNLSTTSLQTLMMLYFNSRMKKDRERKDWLSQDASVKSRRKSLKKIE